MCAWTLAQGTLFWQVLSILPHYNKTLKCIQVARDLWFRQQLVAYVKVRSGGKALSCELE